jgi:hypothetical protein
MIRTYLKIEKTFAGRCAVIPAQAGIQCFQAVLATRFRGYDGVGTPLQILR